MNLSDDELKRFIDDPPTLPKIAPHSQSVERAVKLTSEVVSKAADIFTRNCLAHGKSEARKDIPRLSTKSDFSFV